MGDALIAGEKLDLTLVFSKDKEDGYVIVECLDIPGCMSQGKTEADAKVNIMKAIETCISVMPEDVIRRAGAANAGSEPGGTRQTVSLVIPHLVDSRA